MEEEDLIPLGSITDANAQGTDAMAQPKDAEDLIPLGTRGSNGTNPTANK